jgi:hypothetical protein
VVLDHAEVIFVSQGKRWFRIFSDLPKDSAFAASEVARLGFSGKVQHFQQEDLSRGQRDDRHGVGYVSTWYTEE